MNSVPKSSSVFDDLRSGALIGRNRTVDSWWNSAFSVPRTEQKGTLATCNQTNRM